MVNYNICEVLGPFQQHKQISNYQLENYLRCHHPSITAQILIDDGWLESYVVDSGIWKGDVYYKLTDKAINALNR